jgi:alkanesulfonate monooxygenase SsuD/methylene tetrahydromethanopterin reductase-like flavin-dependent oxidoreductase (luciferase family)
MRLGVALPLTNPDGSALNSTALTEHARTIERLGFRSLWCFDSIGRGSLLPDPLIAVSVAAVTTHLEVGTGVLQVPLRRPVE